MPATWNRHVPLTFVYTPRGFADVYVPPTDANEQMCPTCLRHWRTSVTNEPWPRFSPFGPQRCVACGSGKPKEGW